jgi:hypothetical protein
MTVNVFFVEQAKLDLADRLSQRGGRITLNDVEQVLEARVQKNARGFTPNELDALWEFALKEHKCALCGTGCNWWRAARGSSLCADCFWA